MVKIYANVIFCLLCVYAQTGHAVCVKPSDEHAVYVQTDKEFYLTGEIIWFRVFLMDMQPLLIEGNDLAYVELVNEEGVPVMQARIETGADVSNGGSFWLSNELPTGTYRLYGYTEALTAIGERAFFKKQVQIFNPFLLRVGRDAGDPYTGVSAGLTNTGGRLDIDVQFRDSSLTVRQNATVNLKTRTAGKPVSADVTVSIAKIEAWQPLHRRGIVSYLQVDGRQPPIVSTNRVRGLIDSLGEKETITITYLDDTGNRPLADQDVFISFPGSHFKLYPATTDEYGNAYFYTDLLRGNLMLTTGLFSADKSIVELRPPYWQHYKPIDVSQFPDIPTEELLDRSIQIQVENLYRWEERSRFSGTEKDTIPFYGAGDVTYRLDDYTRFPTMEEVLREYVTEVRVSRHQQRFDLRVLDGSTRYFYSKKPLLLFNGLPVADVSAVMGVDPKRVEKIEVVTSQYYFGSNVYDGIVNFRTYGGGLGGFTLDASVTVLDYDGIQADRKFFAPRYSSADAIQSRLPDMRNVLYWDPRVMTDTTGVAEVHFSTSDVTGTYLISVDGVDREGNVGSQRMLFTVQ